ncbi:MAG: hypothetical protein V4754_12285 [Pseudomonadota bacterium]
MNTLRQLVRVEKLSAISDEEVVISLRGRQLTCFISILPYSLVEGNDYPAQLTLMVFDEYFVENVNDASESSISPMDDGYSYEIVGRLVDGQLHACGFVFDNYALESEYAYLEKKIISISVDRIDVEFLRE